ncbi:hypothetical protein [Kosakonia radicincitans]|uniref:hypothetical protein n=1 Tax=Kosakonia radicincitans TaxID=283686 RepID=UPI001D080DA8|nr:hypothetical protein [Kosakonia radicincitans]
MSDIQLITFVDLQNASTHCVRIIIEEDRSHLFNATCYHITGSILTPIQGCSCTAQVSAVTAFDRVFSSLITSSFGQQIPKDVIFMFAQGRMLKETQLRSILQNVNFNLNQLITV